MTPHQRRSHQIVRLDRKVQLQFQLRRHAGSDPLQVRASLRTPAPTLQSCRCEGGRGGASNLWRPWVGGGRTSGVPARLAAAVVELRQRAELQLSDLLAVPAAVLALAGWNTHTEKVNAAHLSCDPADRRGSVLTSAAGLNVAALPTGRPRFPRALVLPRRPAAPNVSAGHLPRPEAVAAAGGGARRPRPEAPLQGAGLGGTVLQDAGSSNADTESETRDGDGKKVPFPRDSPRQPAARPVGNLGAVGVLAEDVAVLGGGTGPHALALTLEHSQSIHNLTRPETVVHWRALRNSRVPSGWRSIVRRAAGCTVGSRWVSCPRRGR